MTLVLVIGVAAVVSILVLGASRRALVDERQSVRHYQQTLETLRGIGDRGTERAPDSSAHSAPARPAPERTARPAPDRAARHAPERIEQVGPATAAYSSGGARRTTTKIATSGARAKGRVSPPPAASPGVEARRRPSPPLVFDDAADTPAPLVDSDLAANAGPATPMAGASPRPAAARVGAARLRSERRLALGSPMAAAAAVVVVLVGVVIGVVALSGGSRHSPRATPPATRPSTHDVPVETPLSPTSSASSSAATYQVPTASYVIQLTASAPCWVYVTDSTGHVLWTDTLAAGATKAVPAQGQTQVRLGASSVSVTVGGQKVQFPAGMRAPFVATFTVG